MTCVELPSREGGQDGAAPYALPSLSMRYAFGLRVETQKVQSYNITLNLLDDPVLRVH